MFSTTTTGQTTAARQGRSRTAIACTAVAALAAVAVAGIVAFSPIAAHAAAPAAHHSSSATHHASSGTSGDITPAHHTTPSKPVHPVTPVAPSAAVKVLQQQLGDLNYYDGSITGIMNEQTTKAITYLQRDAHLPQTGVMNQATIDALSAMLANGNNQMGAGAAR